MLIFSIESSCDETAAAVVEVSSENGKTNYNILSNIVSSQIDIHKLYGGVVPEIASRAHADVISSVVDDAFQEAGLKPSDIDAVAVTFAPGLIGSLLVGVSFAKALASSLEIPLIPVNHIEAHAAAAYLENPELTPPLIALIVSGGHTSMYDVSDYTTFRVIGETRDDAAGEAFDKVGRVIGLSYPAGREMDRLAEIGLNGKDYNRIPLPSPAIPDKSLDFSFSGLKTAALNYVNNTKQSLKIPDGETLPQNIIENFAASFTQTVTEGICKKLSAALEEGKYSSLVFAGGVAANSHLRRAVASLCMDHGVNFYAPAVSLCGDNAAMVAAAGYHLLKKGVVAKSSLNAYASDEGAQRYMENFKL